MVLPKLDSDCWRFFYKVLKVLHHVSPQVRREHNHYWDALGGVGGRILELGGTLLSEEILKDWTERFLKADWPVRSLIVRAFKGVGPQCTEWDSGLKESLHCYRILCQKSAEVLTVSLTKPIGDTTEWLFEIWKKIAERCRSERQLLLLKNHASHDAQKRAAIERSVCEILDEAMALLAMYDRAEDLRSSNALMCRVHWEEMLFGNTIPCQEWKAEEVEMVATPAVRRSFRGLLDRMGDFVDAAGPDKRKRYGPYLVNLRDAGEEYFAGPSA